uniref:Radical SAM/Cys-rich domain-containing protein n=1 Tax=Candidatus Kentrum sp. FM TaxID=2126340 RepID=A0A450WLX8_9GAMM|nr:MAG: radical SAM/Cys-rich domain-containing protein [Candidatus Kentron sp. FM]VFJ75273.1 MAG: radical SAM/Cys-rich domain-containing protein [Candidatus Kentron sp. FM]VFK18008.1 MAG: radical SAM/Cys-rich domain-containing protein [Candidatus Kentron sp. FM]
MSTPISFPQNEKFSSLTRTVLETLQANLGYRCNQSCRHCHVNAGPHRTEEMPAETVEAVLACLRSTRIATLDLTGGAPELNPHFRHLVAEARRLEVRVIDRCNLTILEEPAQAGLAEFLAEHRVEIIASLPCYLEENVDGQRGKGVFGPSIRALTRLNGLGYGRADTGLVLNLVYNPTGPFLPPPQQQLEGDYKRELAARYGVVFNNLYVLTNLPMARFASMLRASGKWDSYLRLLRNAFRPENLAQVMCRSLVSVDWRGRVYDCDFNQMLDLPLALAGREEIHIRELAGLAERGGGLTGNRIAVGEHCFGCTAGQGSSCGGALGKCEV